MPQAATGLAQRPMDSPLSALSEPSAVCATGETRQASGLPVAVQGGRLSSSRPLLLSSSPPLVLFSSSPLLLSPLTSSPVIFLLLSSAPALKVTASLNKETRKSLRFTKLEVCRLASPRSVQDHMVHGCNEGRCRMHSPLVHELSPANCACRRYGASPPTGKSSSSTPTRWCSSPSTPSSRAPPAAPSLTWARRATSTAVGDPRALLYPRLPLTPPLTNPQASSSSSLH